MITGELKNKIDSLKTTGLGVERIRRNLELGGSDVLAWCRAKIMDENAVIERRGKNWYISVGDCVITVNAGSYTIITAHKTSE